MSPNSDTDDDGFTHYTDATRHRRGIHRGRRLAVSVVIADLLSNVCLDPQHRAAAVAAGVVAPLVSLGQITPCGVIEGPNNIKCVWIRQATDYVASRQVTPACFLQTLRNICETEAYRPVVVEAGVLSFIYALLRSFCDLADATLQQKWDTHAEEREAWRQDDLTRSQQGLEVALKAIACLSETPALREADGMAGIVQLLREKLTILHHTSPKAHRHAVGVLSLFHQVE